MEDKPKFNTDKYFYVKHKTLAMTLSYLLKRKFDIVINSEGSKVYRFINDKEFQDMFLKVTSIKKK